MRVYNKSDRVVTITWNSQEYVFQPQAIVHITDYTLGNMLCARNPNLKDYDTWQKELDEAKSPEEREAMLVPFHPSIQLPLDDAPMTTWLDKAKSLGLLQYGRNHDKAVVIEACKRAQGKVPGPMIPPEPEEIRQRQMSVSAKKVA